MHWQSKAPANIALIKYMGKSNTSTNTASTPSLSLTLDHLQTRLEATESAEDSWEPLDGKDLLPQKLSDRGLQRFLSHWKALKRHFAIEGNYRIRSANNFPSDCGVASSASSFAGLTKLAFEVAKDRGNKNLQISVSELASLSRLASGSSCHSFYTPWCLWNSDGVKEIELGFDKYIHQLIIVDASVKQVSSSEAHKRVETSPHYSGRKNRAEKRLKEVIVGLSSDYRNSWSQIFNTVWDEFIDMHNLFHTSDPSFRYITKSTEQVLESLRSHWSHEGDGPLVTMDAGANIHLIYREDQSKLAEIMRNKHKQDYRVICSEQDFSN